MDRLQAFYPQNGACVGDMNRDGESDDDAILMAKPRKKSSQNLRANYDMNGSVYALRARTRNDSLPTAAFGEVTETEDERVCFFLNVDQHYALILFAIDSNPDHYQRREFLPQPRENNFGNDIQSSIASLIHFYSSFVSFQSSPH
jgi:hypothetical protein